MDFDWRGLAIAGVLARKVVAAEPWRFTASDYRRAVQRGLGTIALSGRPAPSPWDADLGPAMQDAGVAVYEEQVLDDLLADLATWAPRRPGQAWLEAMPPAGEAAVAEPRRRRQGV